MAIISLLVSVAYFSFGYVPGKLYYVNLLLGITIASSICGVFGAYYYNSWLIIIDIMRLLGTSFLVLNLLRMMGKTYPPSVCFSFPFFGSLTPHFLYVCCVLQ